MKKLITILAILFSTTAIAKDIEDYNFGVTQIPVVCGTNELVNEFLTNEDLNAKSLSLGKEGGDENGLPVFLITQYENLEKSKSAATVQVPNNDEVCILYYTFDLMEAPQGKGI